MSIELLVFEFNYFLWNVKSKNKLIYRLIIVICFIRSPPYSNKNVRLEPFRFQTNEIVNILYSAVVLCKFLRCMKYKTVEYLPTMHGALSCITIL